jgi:hypothetical protein
MEPLSAEAIIDRKKYFDLYIFRNLFSQTEMFKKPPGPLIIGPRPDQRGAASAPRDTGLKFVP